MLWRPGTGRKVAVGVGVLLAGALVLAVSVLAEGEPARFAGAFQSVAPLVLLAVLTQLQPFWPAPASARLAGARHAAAGRAGAGGRGATLMSFHPGGSGALPPGAAAPLLVALGMGLSGLLGSLGLLIGGAWARLARWLGGQVDPADLRHAQALVGWWRPRSWRSSRCSRWAARRRRSGWWRPIPDFFTRDRSSSGQLLDQAYDLAWMIPLALLLVGVPLRRTLREALVRLGVRRLGVRGLLARGMRRCRAVGGRDGAGSGDLLALGHAGLAAHRP